MKKFLLTLLCAAATAIASAGTIECSFASGWSSNSSYTGTMTSNDDNWKAINAANNNGGWKYIKIGGKNKSTIGEIQSLKALAEPIKEVSVNITAIANGSITAMELYISDDATFDTSDTKVTATAPTTAKAVTFTIDSPAANKFYCVKISVKNTSTSKNGVASIDKVTFTYNESGPVLEDAGLSFPQEAYTVNLGEAFTAPKLTKATDAAAKYTSSKPEVATVDETTGEVTLVGKGTTVITATTEANDTYKAGEAKYTLNVIDPNATEETYNFTVTDLNNNTAAVTFEPSTLSGITFKTAKNNGQTDPNFNTNGSDLRIYAKGTLTVSIPDGVTVSSIVFNLSTQGLKRLAPITANVGTIAIQTKDDKTVTWTGEVSNGDIAFTVGDKADFGSDGSSKSGQFCFTTGTITTEGSKTESKTPANLKFSESACTATLGSEFTEPTLTKDTDAANINYTSSKPEVATVDATTGKVTLVAAGETVITATTDATETYAAGSASYTLTVVKAYTSIEQILTEASHKEIVKVNFPMTVGYVNGSNCYVTDGKGGYILLYGTTGYEANNVIPAGWNGSYEIYNGLPEIIVSDMPASTENGEYIIETVAADKVMEQPLNKVIEIEDVTLATETPSTVKNFTGTCGETSLTFRNALQIASVAAGNYNVTAAVCAYEPNSTEIQHANQLTAIAYVQRPATPSIAIVNGDEITTGTLDLEKGTKTIVITVAEGSELWYKVTELTDSEEENPASVKALVETNYEGFSKAENNSVSLTLSKNGSVEYFSVLNGIQGQVQKLTVTGAHTTGISEVEAGVSGEAEWFDLQGRRVSAPAKGNIYILKEGSNVSKRAF